MDNKVQIEVEETYTLTINGKRMEGFKKVDTWNGLTKYERGKDKQFVIVHQESNLEDMLPAIFKGQEGSGTVILITPTLITTL